MEESITRNIPRASGSSSRAKRKPVKDPNNADSEHCWFSCDEYVPHPHILLAFGFLL